MLEERKRTTKQQRYKEKHRKAGLCLGCPESIEKGILMCRKCRLKRSEYDREYYKKNREVKKKKSREVKKRLHKEKKCETCGRKLNSDVDNVCLECISCREVRRWR